MKLITRDIDYAIRALSYIAKQKKRTVSAKELVKSLRIPHPFLRKILQRLDKEGFLKSRKGKGGGFSLSCASDEISILDVITVFHRPMKLNTHALKSEICHRLRSCILKKKLDIVEERMMSELDKITISSINQEGF